MSASATCVHADDKNKKSAESIRNKCLEYLDRAEKLKEFIAKRKEAKENPKKPQAEGGGSGSGGDGGDNKVCESVSCLYAHVSLFLPFPIRQLREVAT